MTIIIQHNRTGHYLCATGGWAAEERQALVFDSSLTALGHLFEKRIRDVVLVMRFSDPQYDIRLHPFLEERDETGFSAPCPVSHTVPTHDREVFSPN